MGNLKTKFAKCAGTLTLVAAALATTGCATVGGGSMTPQQSRAVGQGVCMVGGAAVGAAATRNSDPVTRAIGAVVGGYGGQKACGAIFEARAANDGHCQQRVTTDRNGNRVVTENCRRQTPFPGSVQRPQ